MLLDADIPHVHLRRKKKGKGERMTPLAEQTIQALQDYRETLPDAKKVEGKSVFYGIDVYFNRPPTPGAMRVEFETYRKSAGVSDAWLFKHLRNVGPNVRVKLGLPVDLEWAFLGHTWKLGEAQKYEYGVSPLLNHPPWVVGRCRDSL